MKKYELYFHKSGMPSNINQSYGEFDDIEGVCIVIKSLAATHKDDDEIVIKIKNVPES